jgi:NitT/TauT family transport system ATP-binding protein
VSGGGASGGIRAEGLRFGWGGAPVVEGLSLAVAPGEVLVLLGPSGCGKTTVLRLLAGLLEPQEGRIERPEEAPGRAAVGLAFQDPRLLPWMSVRANVEFALEAAGVPKAERRGRVDPLLERVGLSAAAERRPAALSGGMAQRASLVRALALRPRCLLLDEPFGAVDPLLRERLQADLQELLAGGDGDTTAVLVTHDIGEALVLGDEVLVLAGGPCRVRQRLRVEAPRPRGERWRLSDGFKAMERQLREALAGA